MDPRIREHAEIIATHSVDIQQGDEVVLAVPPAAEELAVALHEVMGDRGAAPLALDYNERYDRAFRLASASFETPDHYLALIEECDVFVGIQAARNVTETGDVPVETTAAYRRAVQPLLEERLSKRWCKTQFPTAAHAQLAEMSIEGYENFVWDAINKDWDAVREHQSQLVDILDPASVVRIVAGEKTDLTLDIDGNPAINDYGEKNLPGGEVFTAPVPDSVEGAVHFDVPLFHQGRRVTDVTLRFENGEVVEHSAGTNEGVLTEVLETDAGARRLGELGIGMNRDIDRFTANVLFDEKMGDTVHLALGRAYEDTVGEGNERNDSAVHVDLITDVSEDSFIEVDGEVVQENGTFVFEETGRR